MLRPVLLLTTVALAGVPATAAAASSIPPGQRAHSRVATYVRDGIRVERLQATVA